MMCCVWAVEETCVSKVVGRAGKVGGAAQQIEQQSALTSSLSETVTNTTNPTTHKQHTARKKSGWTASKIDRAGNGQSACEPTAIYCDQLEMANEICATIK